MRTMTKPFSTYLDLRILVIPLNPMHTASKGAGRVLFRPIRGPLAASGIHVNLLAPWLVRSSMTVHLVDLLAGLVSRFATHQLS